MNTSGSRAIFFCYFPPPYNGQSVGTEAFYQLLRGDLNLDRIDIADPWRDERDLGQFGIRYTKFFSGKLRELRDVLASGTYDTLYVVLASSVLGHLRDVAILRSARPHVKRIVAHVHSGNFHELFQRRWYKPLSNSVHRNVDTFLFSSTGLRELSLPYLNGSDARVVPNMVDEAVRFSHEEAISKVARRRTREQFRVVYISNMVPTKGFEDLADALGILHAKNYRQIEAHFVGGWSAGISETAFRERLIDLGIDEWTHVHGSVMDRKRIRDFLANADAFVLPTYYPIEAQPFAIVEALNSATPVVATRHASIPDYVFDGTNGYLVEKRTPVEIANALERLIDTENWARLAVNARETYEQLFAPAATHERLLAAMLGQPDPATPNV